MKIVSCFSDLKELEPLAKAGADEFYTAIEGLPAFSVGFLPGRDLAAAIKKAHALGRKIALAVNAIHAPATNKRLAVMEKRVRSLDKLGMDAFIISNPYLLGLFSGRGKRLRAELHLSSVQPVFNSLSAAFFSRFGVSRLILPNQLSPKEALKTLTFCSAQGIETEIFDYRFFGCAYINGRCHMHRPDHYTLKSAILEGNLCRINARPGGLVKLNTLDLPGRARELPALVKRLENRFTCGGSPRLSNAAAFFDFFTSGAQYLKYGTRHDAPEVKVKKVSELRAMLSLAEQLSASLPPAEARRHFIRELSRWNGGGF